MLDHQRQTIQELESTQKELEQARQEVVRLTALLQVASDTHDQSGVLESQLKEAHQTVENLRKYLKNKKHYSKKRLLNTQSNNLTRRKDRLLYWKD